MNPLRNPNLTGVRGDGEVEIMSKENKIRGYLKSFQDEVKRRKEVLRCGIEGIADEYDIKYGLLVEGQTKPKYSAEMALHHMKGIQMYEQLVEICEESLEQLK